MVSSKQRQHMLGIALLALAIFTAVSLIPVTPLGGAMLRAFPTGNIMGVLGALFASAGVAALGVGVLAVPALLALGGAGCFGWIDGERNTRISALAIGLAV